MLRRLIIGAIVLAVTTPLYARLPDAAQVRGLLPHECGLVAIVGDEDGKLEAELASTGKVLVHALAADRPAVDRARTAIALAAQTGAATVEVSINPAALPYVDNMVNVLVVDLDHPSAMSLDRAEAMRVVAPGGAAMFGHAGQWETVQKPIAPEFGQWTHQMGDASNNQVSTDTILAPASTVRWIDGMARGGVTMAGTGGIPVVGQGVIVQDDLWGYSGEKGGKPIRNQRLICRDAHSGIVRWTQPIAGARLWLAIDGDRLVSAYPIPGRKGAVHVYDLATGQVAHSLDVGLDKIDSRDVHGVVRDGVAFIVVANKLIAFETATGKTRWQQTADGFDGFFSPSLTPDGKHLIVVQSSQRNNGFSSRWPWSSIHAIVALDPITGKQLWRNDAVKDVVTLHVPVTDRYAFFAAPWGIGSHYEHVARDARDKLPRNYGIIDIANGKLLWSKDNTSDNGATGSLWAQVSFFHGDEVFLCQADQFLAWKSATGEVTRQVRLPVTNQRCVRARANENYIIAGFGTFYDLKTGRQTDQNISRSACAVGPTPAYGSIFDGPNGCGCFAQVRGFAAFAPAPKVAVLPDEARLQTGPFSPPTAQPAAPSPKIELIKVPNKSGKSEVDWRAVVSTPSPVRDSWTNNEYVIQPETEPLTLDGVQFVAVVSEHRLEARRDGKILWAVTADARISSAPILHQGKLYFAAHDGWVYCVDPANGTVLWRALVAPNHRRMVAYGQIESAWPVRNVVLFDGLICAAAGRHPELDGGIHLAGLDPATGKARWRKVVAQDTADEWFDSTDRRREKHLNWNTNGGLAVVDGHLQLRGLDMVHGGGNKITRTDPMTIEPDVK